MPADDDKAMRPEPEIYMPTEAAMATAPDGQKLLFFTVPQLDLLIKQVLARQPKAYTYRWAYHKGHKIYVLLFEWPEGPGAGIAIPEGAGDLVLRYMTGVADLYITTEPVERRLSKAVTEQEIMAIVNGNTVSLPGVKFSPET